MMPHTKTPVQIDLEGLVLRLCALADGTTGRSIVGLAGAPGSGKSTVAERLVDAVNAQNPGFAALLPMDGYHFDDVLLNQLGRRARKGAPDTFDVGGLRHMLMRLRACDETEVAVPVFDREIEIARAASRMIPQSVGLVVAEGNYLLLGEAPWLGLQAQFDLTVMIDCPEDELRRRLTARWLHYNLTPDQITAKLEENDLPNGRRVAAYSVPADYILAN